MIIAEQPYEVSNDVQVKKMDCVGQIQVQVSTERSEADIQRKESYRMVKNVKWHQTTNKSTQELATRIILAM